MLYSVQVSEGSNLSKPIRLIFTKNQNPFNLTVGVVIIDSLEDVFYETDALDNRAIEGIMLCYYNQTVSERLPTL